MVPGEIRDAVRIALRSNVPQAITYSLSESTYSIDFAPVLTRNYVNLYARNITELERAEQAALLAQKQRSDILESIQDPFFALDSSWHFTFVNEKAQHLWWKKPVDMVGRSIWEIFPEPIGGTAYEDLRRSMVDRQVRHIETLSQSADTWFELHVYPTSDGGLAVTYRDIDARRKLEEALSIERATLQTACSRMSSRSSHAF
jgi:PAS domain S-box-containing protein